MEAFFFGDTTQRLFGARHEPQGRVRDTAIVICPSWGTEYMRAYRATHLLAEALAAQGFDTLRFDYSCTGDSAGYSGHARVEQWLADIRSASREMLDLSGASRICLLGLRLGALLGSRSLLHGGAGTKPERVVAWDAPASGAHWRERMSAMDVEITARKNRHRALDSKLPPASNEEVLGVPMNAEMAEQLDQLPGLSADPRILKLRSRGYASDAEPLESSDEPNWEHPAWVGTPWLPVGAVGGVAARLREWLP